MAHLLDRLQHVLGDRYRIDREIGRGGTGIVFSARDLKHDRRVAIKVLRPEVGRSLGAERFLREIRIAAQLSHPNIVSLIDSGEADGLVYYVMFYVEGESLRDRLQREKQLPIDEALAIMRAVAEALSYAHRHGVVHRDIKPENILFESGHALVADFGIAKALSHAGGDRLTETGMAVGTPAYMSPEQATGASVDARADIYSLACVLYEMLAGSPAFEGATPQVLLARKMVTAVPSLRVIRDTVPVSVEAAVTRALAKTPADRFDSVDEFVSALSDTTVAAAKRRRLFSPGQRRWLGVLGGIGGIVVLLLVLQRWGMGQPPPSALAATFRQLTADPGVEDFPCMTPDGDWIVYEGDGGGDRDIFYQRIGGRRINLTEDSPADDGQPALSPAGDRIAFRSERAEGGIYVLTLDGAAVRRVTGTGYNPNWSPDGKELAVATERAGLMPRDWERRSRILIVDAGTGESRTLAPRDALQPVWSPHGYRIAYTRRMDPAGPAQMDIWTVTADGGEPVAVTSDLATDWSPAWSPDGRYLYFSSDRGGVTNLWRIHVDEESGRPLGVPEQISAPSGFVAHPCVSADGQRIVFSTVLHTLNVQMAVLDPSTETLADPVWLTTGSRQWSSPDITRNGQSVVFYSVDRPEGDLYTVGSDGAGWRELIADTAIDRVPRWSPDGRRIAYFSTRSGRVEVWIINADGSGNRRLPVGQAEAAMPVWSPDGSRVAVNLLSGGVALISARDPGADPPRPTERLPAPDSAIGMFRVNSWSSDGSQLAGFVGPLSDDGIIVYSLETGRYRRLTDFGQWPVWLPDNRRVLFVSGGNAFHILDTRTRQVRRVYAASRDVLGPPRISGDGRRIVFTRRHTEADVMLATLVESQH